MDYTVGSLADLISGSHTPNKPKVIKKEFIKLEQNDVNENTAKKGKHNKKSFNNSNLHNNIKNENIKNRKDNKVKIRRDGKKSVKPNIEENKLQKNNNLVMNGFKKNKSKKRQFSETGIGDEDLPDNKKQKLNKSGKSSKREKKRQFNVTDIADGADSPPKKQTFNKKGSKNEANDTGEEQNLVEGTPKKRKANKNDKNAERRVKYKIKEENRVQDPEVSARTVFVGNVPIAINKKKIKKHFQKYGDIDSVRIRGVPVKDMNTSKKVAAIKKEFNPNRSNVICYIRFVNKESAVKAEAENGRLLEDHHLRVHSCVSDEKPDESKAIFVGNLSFNAKEDDLWKAFESCGPISYVRIVRDPKMGMGKGFGYVNFKDSDAVQLALEMENVKLNDRELRISLCNLSTAKKNKKRNKNKKITQPGKQKEQGPKIKKQRAKPADGQEVDANQANRFQGTKFSDKSKKRKVNKGLLQKKKLVKKIAPKPN
ncbi:hypothetical protein NQ315_006773 [Exocentrus adspersus]|uniref:RRM domain-containing protein n=1 Tax=Exocentrus adspersus TaxID=1586481 RepID=A0AAV8WCF8_9CUCU|nr:hypothetical protein NQ315_006773 [Exocentrus adspersus]